ncbi:MAG: type II toxin-antitoxin system HicA family toxin [Ignavibacteriaceae bacterium]|nr:type II toxin-antitoxin system HicA family toxin [Ignavibacteriaceae bacterium]
MKPRKAKDVQKVLEKKGFELNTKKNHHQFYCLYIKGEKQAIYTYFSHGKKEYNKFLMNMIKKQLKFNETEKAENFFDCPMTKEQYVEMLSELGVVKKK